MTVGRGEPVGPATLTAVLSRRLSRTPKIVARLAIGLVVAADRHLARRTSRLAAVAAARHVRRPTATASSSTRSSTCCRATTTGPIDRSQLVNKGLSAAIASLNDPYSHYYDPSAYKAFLNQANPHLSGIGIDVQNESQGLRVVDVFADSPAARAGLARGDVIVAVGPTSLANRSADFGSQADQGLGREQGDADVIRRGSQKRRSRSRARTSSCRSRAARSLNYHGMKIGYVQLTSFTDGSGAELRAQVNKVLHQGAHGADPRPPRRTAAGCSTRRSTWRASSFPTARSSRPTAAASRGRSTWPRAARSRPGSRWSCSSIAAPPRRRRSSPAPCRTATAPRSSARTRTARASSRRSSRCPTAARSTSPSASTSPRAAATSEVAVCARAPGSSPDVYALDNPRTAPDEALTVAEQTVAAEAAVSAPAQAAGAGRARRRARAPRQVPGGRAVLRGRARGWW